MKKNGKIFGDVIPGVTVAVLFLVILMLVVFSAMTYQRSVELQDQNNNKRAVLSYVITAVKAGSSDNVRVEELGGMQYLAIADADTGYEQQIWFQDGQVMESYGKTGNAPDAEEGIVIGSCGRFEFEQIDDDLLELKTDLGNSYVHIRGGN